MLTTILHASIMISVFSMSSGQEPESASPVLASINQCCDLGAERAQSPELGCEDIPVPVKDVIEELQAGSDKCVIWVRKLTTIMRDKPSFGFLRKYFPCGLKFCLFWGYLALSKK